MTSIQRVPPHCSIRDVANLRCHPWSFRSSTPPRILDLHSKADGLSGTDLFATDLFHVYPQIETGDEE
jgi:hypothetical protein